MTIGYVLEVTRLLPDDGAPYALHRMRNKRTNPRPPRRTTPPSSPSSPILYPLSFPDPCCDLLTHPRAALSELEGHTFLSCFYIHSDQHLQGLVNDLFGLNIRRQDIGPCRTSRRCCSPSSISISALHEQAADRRISTSWTAAVSAFGSFMDDKS